MRYQYKQEPLTQEEANRLANACQTHEEKLVIWTLLDTGLRVAERAKLTKDNLDWQNHRLMIYAKGGPYGKLSKRRIIPLSPMLQPILEGHLGLHDSIKIGIRTIQRMVKQVANKAHIRMAVSPHVLRHTFAVACIQKGISTRALQEIVGHDRLATTEIYLNLSPEDVIHEFHSKWQCFLAYTYVKIGAIPLLNRIHEKSVLA